MKDELIFTFKNGGVTHIKTFEEYFSGYCDTCDYGARTTHSILFKTTHHNIMLNVVRGEDKGVSLSFLMRWIIRNIQKFKKTDEDGFIEIVKTDFYNDVKREYDNDDEWFSYEVIVDGQTVHRIISEHEERTGRPW